jgi:subfamily B ATP-binding cassette protein MsbA
MKKNLALFFRAFVRPQFRYGLPAIVLMLFGVVLQLPMPLVTKYIIDSVLPGTANLSLETVGIVLFLLVLLGLGLNFFSIYLSGLFRERLVMDIQSRLFEHVLKLPMSFHEENEPGYLMSRIGNDTGNLNSFFADTAATTIQNVFTFVVGVVAIAMLNMELAVVCWITIVPYVAAVLVFQKSIRKRSGEMQEQIGHVWANMSEVMHDILPMKLVKSESFFAGRFRGEMENALAANMNFLKINLQYGTVSAAISGMLSVYLLIMGGHLVMNDKMTLGTLMAFLSFTGYVFGPVKSITQSVGSLQHSLVALARVYDILNLEDEYGPGNADGELDHDDVAFAGDIVYGDLNFSYGDGRRALKDLNLQIRPGETLAIVGPSGSGKSTLGKLLCMVYPDYEGSLRIGAKEVRGLAVSSLRRKIGYVPQEVSMYSMSLRDNLKLGREGYDHDLVACCEVAGIAEVLAEKGLDFDVGSQSGRISGGEKQRFGIARALLSNPELILLDEATSDLDEVLEDRILKNLKRHFADRTIVMITHRLSTLVNVDRICVMNDGRVVDIGTHSELTERCREYRDLYER